VLSRVPREQAAEQDGRFSAIATALQQAHLRFAVVDSVYDTPDDDPAADLLRNIQGGLLFLGWYHARALKWTLARRTPPPTPSRKGSEETTAVQCLDVRASSPDALVAQVTRIVAGACSADVSAASPLAIVAQSSGLRGDPAGRPTTAAPRWYPVIDYSLCTNCMECLDFCLFGVFGVDAQETLRVVSPEQCRQDCPACARVCPAGAIIFPKYKGDPAIAGAEPAVTGRVRKLDLSGLFGKPKDRRQAMLERDSALLKSSPKPAGADRVEQLAQEFDKLKL